MYDLKLKVVAVAWGTLASGVVTMVTKREQVQQIDFFSSFSSSLRRRRCGELQERNGVIEMGQSTGFWRVHLEVIKKKKKKKKKKWFDGDVVDVGVKRGRWNVGSPNPPRIGR